MWEPGLLWAARRWARDVALVLPGERQAGECVRAVRAVRAVHEHEPRRSADRRHPCDDDEAEHRRQEHRDRRACRPGGPAPHPCLRQTSLRQQVVPLISGRRPLARSWADPGATDKVSGRCGGSGAKMRLPRWQRQCGPDMTRPASWVVSPSPRAFVVEGLNPGFPHPGEHFLLRQSGRYGLPKTRPDLDGGLVTGFPNPRGPPRPAAMTM